MFIFWGRKITRKSLGYVADFCAICRKVTAFQLSRVGSAGHIYYLSVGEGVLVGHERSCCECGSVQSANTDTYTRPVPKPGPIDALIRETYPGLERDLAERLQLEQQIRFSPHMLEPGVRAALIKEPLVILAPKVEQRFASTRMDMGVGLALLVSVFLFVFSAYLSSKIDPDAAALFMPLALLVGVGLVIWQFLASRRRYMRKEIIPLLARSLAPLKPREQEIQQALQAMKQLGYKIGKFLQAAEVTERAQAALYPMPTV